MKSKIWLSLSLILVLSGIALAQTARKTITNFDLEKYKEQREKSEAEYRAKHKELGMPSPEELEKRQQEAKRLNEERIRQNAFERQQNQNYWQIRANDLRNEIFSVNAQINYLNSQLSNTPNQNSVFMTPQQFYSVGVVSGRGYRRGSVTRQQATIVNPANNVQTAINAAGANPNPFYGTPLAQNGVKVVVGNQQNHGRRGGYGRNYGGYIPYVANGNNYSQKDELNSRLQYLGQVRAGLFAQWNNLVDEAHRAGVKLTF